jgi:hypothetical protein
MTGRGNPAASETEEPILTRRHLANARPVPRSIEEWCLIISLCLMASMACWLVVAGSTLARVSSYLSHIEFRPPSFQMYLATLPGKTPPDGGDVLPLTASEIAAVNTLAAIERAFESIRQFENARAEFRLGKAKSVLSGVTPGSPAQQAGLQKGDELITIWGKPAGSVWEFFTAVAANGAPSAEVELKRGETVFRATLMQGSGAQLDLGNMGAQIDVPDGVRYLGPGDARRLAEDFIRGYVESVSPEWRKAYAASLDSFMRALSKRVEDQKARSPRDPAYLRSELMLVWHHEAFTAELERLRSKSAEATQAVAAAMSGLGRAAAGLATTILLALVSLAWRARNSVRHRGRR